MTETHAACKETIDALLAENRALRAETPRIDGRPSECVRLRESNKKLVKALERITHWAEVRGVIRDETARARAAIANATESPTQGELK